MPKETEKDPATVDVADGVVLRAILAVLVAQRDGQQGETPQTRTEIVLSDVGIETRDIASLLGKNPDAVRMLISRARKSEKKG